MRPDGPACYDCPYCPEGSKFIPPDGNGASRILFVGDSPWKDEQHVGRVFAGAAGKMLDRILSLMPGGGLQRNDLTIWNSIQCSPPHLGWMDSPARYPLAGSAIEHCRPHLDGLIAERSPSVIVPLGNVALRRVVGLSGIEAVAGYVLPTPYGIPAVPTYHPSFLMKGQQNLIPVVLWAFNRAQEIAQGTYKESEYELLLDPTPEEMAAYFAQDYEEMFLDIETPESGKLDEEELEEEGVSFTIIRAGASIRKGTAISFPFVQPFIDIFLKAIDRARRVVEWADNRFDTRRLAVAGASFLGKQVISGMWAWHWLQSDLRKGLNLVAPFYYAGRPWKHLSQAEPAYYNAMDNAVGNDCYLGISKALQQQGRWEAFLRYCVEPTPYLESMGKAGLLINTEYRKQFMDTIKVERDKINVRIQALVPDVVKPRKFWKKQPKDMTGVVLLDAPNDVVPPNGAKGGPNPPERPSVEKLPSVGERVADLLNEVADAVSAKTGKPVAPYRFMRVEEFNPGSWQQVQALANTLKVKLPKKEGAESEDDTSTDEKALKKAMKDKKHGQVFKEIFDWRKRNKLITAYTWPLDDQNRVHYTFGYHPSTWRKSCRSVAIQTIPKRSDLAKKFRKMIVAAPGHVLIEGDSAAIEAVLVGWLAGSERYIRLAKAGIHGYLTAASHGDIIPLSVEFEELQRRSKAAKKQWPDDYERSKRVAHLTNYLGTPRRIFEEYPDDFDSEASARKLQQVLLGTEAGTDIKRWQKASVEEAHGNKYLENFYGLRHRFYTLYQWNHRMQRWDLGDDAKRAVAFRPQSIASFIQTDVVLRMVEWGWLDALRAIIHDSLVLEVRDADAIRAAASLYAALVEPRTKLGGLEIGAEVSIGRNLAPYSEDNPEGMIEMSQWQQAVVN